MRGMFFPQYQGVMFLNAFFRKAENDKDRQFRPEGSYKNHTMALKNQEHVNFDNRLAGVHVLVIDNDATIRGLLENVLFKLGFSKVYTAADGYEGIQVLKQRPVDLIITDWELRPVPDQRSKDLKIPKNAVIQSEWGDYPPENGASFVKCLRHSKFSPNPFVPVIMFTGPTLPNHIRYARDAGVNEMLLKPIDARALVNRIKATIERPRNFVTASTYKGPCRRRKQIPLGGKPDRRKEENRVISFYEQQKAISNG